MHASVSVRVAGGFACAAWPDIAPHAADVALADLNGDDHLDAVFAYPDAGVEARRCLGTGAGSFASASVTGAGATSGVAAGPLRY